MKKLLAILMVALMLLGLAACEKDVAEKPTIVGTWEGTVDLGPAMEVSLKAEAMFNDAIPTEIKTPLVIDVTYVFNADGTYSSTVDEDSLENMLDAMVDVMIEVMYAPRMDLDEALAESGMTMAEFKEQLKASAGMDAGYAAEAFNVDGFYKYEDGKITAAKEKEQLETGELIEVCDITLTDTTMTITDIILDGEKISKLAPDMFPTVFTRK